jgi:hypothetical protein
MNIGSDDLEDRVENYKDELKGIKSYVKELQTMTAKHGTDPEQYEVDLMEAQHNIEFYEGEIAECKNAMGKSPKPGGGYGGAGATPANGPNKGITSVIVSSVSFILGAILGSTLKSRSGK